MGAMNTDPNEAQESMVVVMDDGQIVLVSSTNELPVIAA